jgi:hypothetical protein
MPSTPFRVEVPEGALNGGSFYGSVAAASTTARSDDEDHGHRDDGCDGEPEDWRTENTLHGGFLCFRGPAGRVTDHVDYLHRAPTGSPPALGHA